MEAKTASASYTTMNELVLPNDTNTYGDLMGGRLMYWMDIAAYLSAAKHCNSGAMTASVDNISFKTPIKLGNVICIEAKVTRAFTTSMEIHLKVWNQNTIEQTRVLSNEAYFTFVALDAQKQPKKSTSHYCRNRRREKIFCKRLKKKTIAFDSCWKDEAG